MGSGWFGSKLNLRRSKPIRAIRILAAAVVSLGCLPLWATTSSHKTTTHHASASGTPHPAQATAHKSGSTKKTHSASHGTSAKGRKTQKTAGHHGQQKIDSERAQAIQQALVREHYLDSEPTGQWDDASQKAMEKFQADNGWQSKVVPDSRALIKLGLGPNQEHLLNPQTAMTAMPAHAAASGLTDVPQPSSPQR
jgi:hypothetical protein